MIHRLITLRDQVYEPVYLGPNYYFHRIINTSDEFLFGRCDENTLFDVRIYCSSTVYSKINILEIKAALKYDITGYINDGVQYYVKDYIVLNIFILKP